MSEEKPYNELIKERNKQEKNFEEVMKNWRENLTKEDLEKIEQETESARKKNRLITVSIFSLFIIPFIAFYAVHGGTPFDDEYLEEPDDEESEEYEAYMQSTYAIMAGIGLPIIVWWAIPFAVDPFTKKENEIRLEYPLLGMDDDDLAVMATDRIEGTDMGDLMEAIESGRISQCPQCEEFALERRSLGGRAAKGVARGIGGIARWYASQAGGMSMVGSRGGVYDSITEDVAFSCINCGYHESDEEFVDRMRR